MNDVSAVPVVIVARPTDEHASAVADLVRDRVPVRLLDVVSLPHGGWRWSDGLLMDTDGIEVRPQRGWLRRLAPPDWHLDMVVGSLEYIEAQAALQALTALVDPTSGVAWLSDYWSVVRGENKLIQYAVAKSLGVRVPDSIVGSNRAHLADLGGSFVVKPLAGGGFTRGDARYAIHAQLIDATDPRLEGLGTAPFLAQRHVPAVRHLRIPTVAGRSWACEISASGLPLDWREDEGAHYSWRPCARPEPAAELAVKVAVALQLGYSCQDWIIDAHDVPWLIDVNPAGQWLFLPGEVADGVSQGIADWLVLP